MMQGKIDIALSGSLDALVKQRSYTHYIASSLINTPEEHAPVVETSYGNATLVDH